MNKIASTRELQDELHRILRLAQEPNPSRVHLAGELHTLAERLVVAAKVDWTHEGDQWMVTAKYANGKRHDWIIKEAGGKFQVNVKTDGGTFKCKKPYDSLDKAQRYAAKFIDKAHGWEMLEEALDKDFTKA